MRSRAQKRPEILRAAAIVFAEVGYHAATTAEIAAAAGMTPGNIYYHIQSKEQLLFDVLMDAMRFGLGIIQSVRKAYRRSPARQLFHAIYETMVAACQRVHPGMLLFFFTREHRTALTPEHWRRYVAARDKYEQHFRDMLREGIAKGDFQETDIVLEARLILGAIQWIHVWFRPEGPLSAQEVALWHAKRLVGPLLRDQSFLSTLEGEVTSEAPTSADLSGIGTRS
ncbi:MAG TPA: TetR/AcrR family transcriptional regulator [Dehalococcoidia bacterium]|nr:TetR/AcrR family transcriptional regulator [Dehalococcoidia bacterium]